jgi:hypothetical protein
MGSQPVKPSLIPSARRLLQATMWSGAVPYLLDFLDTSFLLFCGDTSCGGNLFDHITLHLGTIVEYFPTHFARECICCALQRRELQLPSQFYVQEHCDRSRSHNITRCDHYRNSILGLD